MIEDNPTAEELAEFDRLQAKREGRPHIPSQPAWLDLLQNKGGQTARITARRPMPISEKAAMDKHWNAFVKQHKRQPENKAELAAFIAAGGGI